MPYRRHKRCPLLTTHGHVIVLLRTKGALRRVDIIEALSLADTTVRRLLSELAGEGLIAAESHSGSTWWSVNPEKMTPQRLAQDRE